MDMEDSLLFKVYLIQNQPIYVDFHHVSFILKGPSSESNRLVLKKICNFIAVIWENNEKQGMSYSE